MPKAQGLLGRQGVDAIGSITIPAEDRNRTSPFPYGGHRFEFRAVGSAQNVSLVNTVLNTITANAFKEVADRIEGGETAQAVAADLINTVLCTIIADSFAYFSSQIDDGKKATDVAAEALEKHWKVIFNGNGYSEEWPIEAGKRGVWRIDSGVEAMARIAAPENIALFERQKVMSAKECTARAEVMHDHYTGYVEIEAMAMVDMLKQHGETLLVLPVLLAACLHPIALSCDKPHDCVMAGMAQSSRRSRRRASRR